MEKTVRYCLIVSVKLIWAAHWLSLLWHGCWFVPQNILLQFFFQPTTMDKSTLHVPVLFCVCVCEYIFVVGVPPQLGLCLTFAPVPAIIVFTRQDGKSNALSNENCFVATYNVSDRKHLTEPRKNRWHRSRAREIWKKKSPMIVTVLRKHKYISTDRSHFHCATILFHCVLHLWHAIQ